MWFFSSPMVACPSSQGLSDPPSPALDEISETVEKFDFNFQSLATAEGRKTIAVLQSRIHVGLYSIKQSRQRVQFMEEKRI